MRWAVGVVTAPRPSGFYLGRTVGSIAAAGFPEPVVFAEPDSPTPVPFKGHVVRRRKQYGDWANWATGLYELLLSEPESDYFLMAEDDAVVCRGARRYLESSLPSLGEFASLSLYTPSIYRRKRTGFHNENRGKRTWSTVTVVMARDKAVSFFSDPDVQSHRFKDVFGEPDEFWSCSADPRNSVKDAVIGTWAEKNDWPVFYHTPSLAEHVGQSSVVNDKPSTPANGRMSADFVGEDCDLFGLTTPPHVNRHVTIPL